MIKQYLKVIKPGIICGNLVSVMGGYLLAAKGLINYKLLITTLIGVSLVVASACVFNNYIDRDIDSQMERTKNRALVNGLISPKISKIYATTLCSVGFILLYLKTNIIVTWLAVIGFIIYVGIYSLYMKRKSVYGILGGSLSGAIPPVIGYCAVSNQLDICAFLLLLIFSLWQIPHSYAIAIFHLKDYQISSIPILPVKYGVLVTKHHIVFYIIGYIIATLMLMFNGYVGYKYLIITTLVNIYWLGLALQGYKLTNNDTLWAHRLFVFSIITIVTLNVVISLDYIIPPTVILTTY